MSDASPYLKTIKAGGGAVQAAAEIVRIRNGKSKYTEDRRKKRSARYKKSGTI
jgi:hypothetical protein